MGGSSPRGGLTVCTGHPIAVQLQAHTTLVRPPGGLKSGCGDGQRATRKGSRRPSERWQAWYGPGELLSARRPDNEGGTCHADR